MISILYKINEKSGCNYSYLWSYSPFLIFFDHQDTEYESRGLKIGVVGPVFTHKNIKGYIGQQYP